MAHTPFNCRKGLKRLSHETEMGVLAFSWLENALPVDGPHFMCIFKFHLSCYNL
jgi:hypothetical protein